MLVTRLGFGSIPIQRCSDDEAAAVIQKCLDLGLNFIDTATGYSTSEERIGRAIKGRRQDVIIATKTTADTPEDIRKHLHQSLKRLGTDYIDLYQFHNVREPAMVLDPSGSLIKVFEDAKKAGKIRHIGVSCHSMDIAKELVKSDRFETLLFPFNFVTSEPAEELLPLCREHDTGFIVMKPLAGGMLDNATIAFKYLFQFPDILIIPGIEKIPEIEEIVRIYEGPHQMSATERRLMQQMREKLGILFCRRCNYYQPCPQEIPIPALLTFPSVVKRQPPERFFEGEFGSRQKDAMDKAATCQQCGECEEKCPYHLSIREMLSESLKLYEELKARYD